MTQVCTLYWPRSATSASSGWLVGWNIGGFVSAVAAVVGPETPYDELLAALADVEPAHSALRGGRVDVVGRWHSEPPGGGPLPHFASPRTQVSVLQQSADFWIELECAGLDAPVVLREIFCCGYRYTRVAMHVVVFDPPTRPHFLSMTPLVVDPAALPSAPSATPPPPSPPPKPFFPPKSGTPATFAPPIASSPRFDAGGPVIPDTAVILDHINVAAAVATALSPAPPPPPPSTLPLPLRLATTLLASLWAAVAPLFVLLAAWAPPLIAILNAPFPAWLTFFVAPHLAPLAPPTLVSASSVAKVLDERLRQLAALPDAVAAMNDGGSNEPAARARYLDAANGVWLLVNDLLFGVVALAVVRNHAADAIQLVHRSALLLTGGDILSSHLMWLMGWPSGFKLNANFDAFLGAHFMSGIEAWRAFTDWLSPANIYFFYTVLLSSTCGLSMMLAVLSDMLSVITLHVYVFYRVAAALYKLVADVMSSLWKLFRGKKYNVLRRRIDSCNYNLDQLLLGTILFTILFFLAPTVIVYYTFFTLARLAIVTTQLGLVVAISLLHSFPLFPLVVYTLSPALLPGGIRFLPIAPASLRLFLPAHRRNTRRPHDAHAPAPTYFELRSRPLPLSAVFFNLSSLAARLAAHHPLALRPLLTGLPIRAPPDLRPHRHSTVPSAPGVDE